MESFSRSVLRTCSIDIHKSGCNLTSLKFLQLLYQIFNALRSKDSFNSVLFRCPKYVLASLQNDLISSIQIGSFLPPFTRTNSVTLNRLEALPQPSPQPLYPYSIVTSLELVRNRSSPRKCLPSRRRYYSGDDQISSSGKKKFRYLSDAKDLRILLCFS